MSKTVVIDDRTILLFLCALCVLRGEFTKENAALAVLSLHTGQESQLANNLRHRPSDNLDQGHCFVV